MLKRVAIALAVVVGIALAWVWRAHDQAREQVGERVGERVRESAQVHAHESTRESESERAIEDDLARAVDDDDEFEHGGETLQERLAAIRQDVHLLEIQRLDARARGDHESEERLDRAITEARAAHDRLRDGPEGI